MAQIYDCFRSGSLNLVFLSISFQIWWLQRFSCFHLVFVAISLPPAFMKFLYFFLSRLIRGQDPTEALRPSFDPWFWPSPARSLMPVTRRFQRKYPFLDLIGVRVLAKIFCTGRYAVSTARLLPTVWSVNYVWVDGSWHPSLLLPWLQNYSIILPKSGVLGVEILLISCLNMICIKVYNAHPLDQ